MDKPINKHNPPDAAAVLHPEFSMRDTEGWASQTLRQIEKDFRMQGIDIQLPEASPGLDILVEKIAGVIAAQKLFERKVLFSLLYQLDLDEHITLEKLKGKHLEEACRILSTDIIKRCLTKVYWKNTLR